MRPGSIATNSTGKGPKAFAHPLQPKPKKLLLTSHRESASMTPPGKAWGSNRPVGGSKQPPMGDGKWPRVGGIVVRSNTMIMASHMITHSAPAWWLRARNDPHMRQPRPSSRRRSLVWVTVLSTSATLRRIRRAPSPISADALSSNSARQSFRILHLRVLAQNGQSHDGCLDLDLVDSAG